jgi:two-component system cell cycle response regulator
MNTLVQVAFWARRASRRGLGFVAAAAVAWLAYRVMLRQPVPSLPWLPMGNSATMLAIGACWLVALSMRVREFSVQRAAHPVRAEVELGLLIIAPVYALLAVTGNLLSPLVVLLYVSMAMIASFACTTATWVITLSTLAFHSAIVFGAHDQIDMALWGLQSAGILFFGVFGHTVTHAALARLRHEGRKALQHEKDKAHDEVRLFRLVTAPTDGTGWDEERLVRSSVQEVHQSLYYALQLLKQSMQLHTAVLLLRDDHDHKLRIAEICSDSDAIAQGPFEAGEGAVGAIAVRGLVTNLERLKPGYAGLCYYRGSGHVRAFLGVPVLEGNHVRGALCIDRTSEQPFDATDEHTLRHAAAYMLRMVENERVFVQLERSKHEQGILYRASQSLGQATTEPQVLEAGLLAAKEIANYDVAAVTTYDPMKRKHLVKKTVGADAASFEGLTFSDNSSLTAMVVRNRHYLPYRGEFDSTQQILFTKRANLHTARSLLVLPLIVGEQPIGTLMVGSARPGAFRASVRPTLQVLANQVAVSLSNAASMKRLEELATTDGLTGCFNKRAFLEELDRKIRAAGRFHRKLSLVVADIDHFKQVNDTYGHATGDKVLQKLGAILQEVKRETDMVARFGGEEFCILCEETDTAGAVLLAERVRQELGSVVFQTEHGMLQVTCSLGVASFPDDANNRADLFERADKALYAAKHAGRNRVCTASLTRLGAPASAAPPTTNNHIH